tara:strand:- start:12605 stop:14383 length:1779 start_codon:yes stop_codon:yes gene_type:complete
MDIIKILPENISNQIAAGEVIQRPASVLKELVENSIDADASFVQIILKDSGKTLIKVIDDGIGMSKKDLRISFQRHSTSKLNSSNDLFKIKTKGFRGEALSSISSISEVEIHTNQSNHKLGNMIIIHGDKIQEEGVSSIEKGTSVNVKKIFYNVPARRNFLKSDNVELKKSIDELHRLALAHPEIKFKFHHNKTELFNLPSNNIKKRICSIFGNKINEFLLPIKERTSVANLDGYIVKPDFAKKTRGHQFLFVNNRFIKNPFLNHAVVSAYKGLLSEEFHPGYFIFLSIDPSKIDINIHPTKTEVKFEEEQSIFAILKSSIKHSLGVFQITPSLDFNNNSIIETPYDFNNKKPNYPTLEINSKFNPFFKSETKDLNSSIGLFEDNIRETNLFSENFNFKKKALSSIESQKVFQLFSKYIVSPLKSSLIIINQNRAHQRILYERFLSGITSKKVISQNLVFPIIIDVKKISLIFFNENYEILKSFGFKTELKKSELIIKGAPSGISHNQIKDSIENFLDLNNAEVDFNSLSQADYIAKNLAKSLSVKSGVTLKIDEQKALVDDLFACKENLLCPYNRKIFITFSEKEIEKKIN